MHVYTVSSHRRNDRGCCGPDRGPIRPQAARGYDADALSPILNPSLQLTILCPIFFPITLADFRFAPLRTAVMVLHERYLYTRPSRSMIPVVGMDSPREQSSDLR